MLYKQTHTYGVKSEVVSLRRRSLVVLRLRGGSHLHHLVVKLGELPLLPVVQHPDLVRLA